MTSKIYGGVDIAMKIPPHQYQATIDFYRDVIGQKPITDKAPAVGFELGPNKLWLDEAPGMSQAEVWLEFFTDDFEAAAGCQSQSRRWLRWVSVSPLRKKRS